jgi:nitroreductase
MPSDRQDPVYSVLQARYDSPDNPALSAPLSPFLEQLLAHRSVRHYRPDPVSDEQLTLLVAAAQSAANSSNLQPWSVVAVRDPKRRAHLAQLAGDQAHVAQAPLLLMWLADLARLKGVAHSVGRPFEALNSLEMLMVGVIDAALAAQNAAAAAESLGLGTCYIGGMRNKPEEVARCLALPEQVFAVFGMTIGYEDPEKPAAIKPRLPQPVVLHQETYTPVDDQLPGVAAYNAAMGRFYHAQGMNVKGVWADHSAKRIADAKALTGRDRLCEALKALGFSL